MLYMHAGQLASQPLALPCWQLGTYRFTYDTVAMKDWTTHKGVTRYMYVMACCGAISEACSTRLPMASLVGGSFGLIS
jgi:hypothetical protein